MTAIRISHSDIASFLRCRRQFDLGYVSDWKAPDKPYGPLACGSRVHLAVDTHHRTGRSVVDIHQELATADEKVVLASDLPGWAVEEFYTDVILGRNCCAAYAEWIETDGPYDGFDVETEVILEKPILDGRAILQGKADLKLTRHIDGTVFIDDLKTSSPHVRTTLPVLLEKSYQHVVYEILADELTDYHVGGAFYTVLFKVKVPARATHPMVERFAVPAHASSYPIKRRQIEQIVSDMLEMMERRETVGPQVAYPSPGDSCRWCDFKHPCQMLDENPLGARAMLDAEFQRGGRHARYDA